MANKPIFFIGTPHNQIFPFQYVISLFKTVKRLSKDYHVGGNFVESAYVHANRNLIMKKSLTENCDYLMFIDSDMVWEPSDIEKLIKFDRKVVSGLYLTRRPYDGRKAAPVVYRYNNDRVLSPVYDLPDNVFKCDAVGAGFLLLKREVVEKMVELIPKIGFPWDFMPLEDVNAPKSDRTGLFGEDLAFCHRLKKAGFDIWCDPTVRVGHITTSVIP